MEVETWSSGMPRNRSSMSWSEEIARAEGEVGKCGVAISSLQILHVLERGDRHAAFPHFPFGARVVRVVPHEGREVEGDRQTRLTVIEEELVAPVRVLRRAEPGE